jgi:signal transduction histidine kinase
MDACALPMALEDHSSAMTLARFINENLDLILAEWEAFALTLQPAAETATALALHKHAREILQAMARDMENTQTGLQQSDKSKGWGPVLDGKETAAATHGALLHLAGYDLRQLTAEYRALRASVLKLWREHLSAQEDRVLTEMTRFNEAVDQALAESVSRYSDELWRSRNTFLAILGHDLRSPLTVIAMSAHRLATPGKVAPAELEFVARIRQSVLSMNLMIRDLLEYTRTRLGKGIPVLPILYDVGLSCEKAHDEVQAGHPDCEIDLELVGDLRAEIDPARFAQVLSNLLNNAVQYGATDRPIILHARGEPDTIELQVTNFGAVIPAEMLQIIFNPLVQVHDDGSSSKALSTSIGLGLFIADDIVRAHGGTLEVSSSEAGGTVFSIRLPRVSKRRLIA